MRVASLRAINTINQAVQRPAAGFVENFVF